jgi:nucleoside-diphosphate-sugar epimerase/glycosyltransferase involved in cell wall biosynthesis
VKILITGANGFIGRRLSAILKSDGHEVRRAVRAHDGLPDTVELPDSALPESLMAACTDIDCVIHLAASVHVMGRVTAELQRTYQATNVNFSLRLADAAQKAGVSRFVFVSTIKVCGERSGSRPLCETDIPQPIDFYARSKLDAEKKLRDLAEKTALELVIVRPPLVYGPEVRANFRSLLSAVSASQVLPFAMLRNKRSLIYIENFASALVACASHPRAAGEIFHVADAVSITLSDLVTELSTAMGKRPRLFNLPKGALRLLGAMFGKSQQIERIVNDLEVDSSKIRGLLGWKPAYSFRDGIQATVDWYLQDLRPNAGPARPIRTAARQLRVCQVCAVDFTLQHLLMPLVDGMREQGWLVAAVCSDGRYAQEIRRRGYRVHSVQISRNLFAIISHLRAIRDIRRFCVEEDFDVLHVHTPIAALLARVAGRLAGVPVIIYTAHGFYFHDEMPRWKYRAFVWLERWGGRLTDYLFTQSSEDARTAVGERIALPTQVTAIGNGVSVEMFSPDHAIRAKTRHLLGLHEKVFLVGVVARLVREKGIVEFLEAAKSLGARFPHVCFLLVGERLQSDYDTSIEDELTRAREVLGSRLIVTGYRADVADLLRAMDLFCLPSYREGMPRSIIEAMMMGLPVVGTDIRGTREEVVPGKTGLLVPTRDVVALTRALEALIVDPEMSRRLGQAGRARALDQYDERRVIAQQVEVIRSLAAESLSGADQCSLNRTHATD